MLAARAPGPPRRDGEPIVERVLAQGPKGVAAVVLHDNAAHLAMRRGRLDRAAEHFELARELLGGTSDSMWIGNQAAGRAETALWAADPEHAWQIATGALDFVPRDQYAHYTTRLHATALRAARRAQRAHALGDAPRRARGAGRRPRDLREPARPAGPRALARRRAGSRAGRLRRAERRRALAGRGAPGPERLGAAAERFDALSEPFELRLRALAPGRGADRRRRPAPAAAAALREAAELAAALGAPLLAARGRGRSPRRRARRRSTRRRRGRRRGRRDVDRLGLTAARARRSSSLVAEGHTNREIGDDALHGREDRERPRVAHPGQARRALSASRRRPSPHRLGLAATSAPGHGGRG